MLKISEPEFAACRAAPTRFFDFDLVYVLDRDIYVVNAGYGESCRDLADDPIVRSERNPGGSVVPDVFESPSHEEDQENACSCENDDFSVHLRLDAAFVESFEDEADEPDESDGGCKQRHPPEDELRPVHFPKGDDPFVRRENSPGDEIHCPFIISRSIFGHAADPHIVVEKNAQQGEVPSFDRRAY